MGEGGFPKKRPTRVGGNLPGLPFLGVSQQDHLGGPEARSRLNLRYLLCDVLCGFTLSL